jgi:hypothetical protein
MAFPAAAAVAVAGTCVTGGVVTKRLPRVANVDFSGAQVAEILLTTAYSLSL